MLIVMCSSRLFGLMLDELMLVILFGRLDTLDARRLLYALLTP